MLITRPASLIVLSLLLLSCVTINVYFPAAAAEKAADRIIDEVLGEDSNRGGKTLEPPQPDSSFHIPSRYNPSAILVGVLDFVVGDAHAQAAADIDISSPAINQLKSAMQIRHAKLSKYYKAGVIGHSADGLVAVRDLASLGLRDRGVLKKLLAQENRDRTALYKELARANGQPDWEPQIRATFARRWVARTPAGWYYRDRAGNWKKK